MKKTIKIAYLRRSSEDKKKQVQSIPTQQEWCSHESARRGVTIEHFFSDTKTGKEPGRAGFGKMISLINSCQLPVEIYCWRIDRLARNPIDESAIKWAFMNGQIHRIIAKDREFNEGDSQILMGLEFSVATQYSIDLSGKVIDGMETKNKKGWRPTYAPLGYINDPLGIQGEKKIFVDNDRFNLIKTAWEMLITGNYSVPQIKKSLDEKGLKTRKGKYVSLSSWYKIFTNLFYSGSYEWKNEQGDIEIRKGKHIAMISLDDYDNAQFILGRKGRARQRTHEHAYNGVIKCGECGCMITTEPPKRRVNKKSGKVRIYNYMRCTKKNPNIKCSQKYIQVKELEKQIDGILEHIEVPQAFIDWGFKVLRSHHKEKTKTMVKQRRQILKQINDNESMADTLLNKLLKGVIDDKAYQIQKNKFTIEKARLSNELSLCDDNKEEWIDSAEKLFKFAKNARSNFENGNLETKRIIFSSLGSNFLLNDKKLTLELTKPFKNIEKCLLATKDIMGSLEPLKHGLEQVKQPILDQVIPVWSG